MELHSITWKSPAKITVPPRFALCKSACIHEQMISSIAPGLQSVRCIRRRQNAFIGMLVAWFVWFAVNNQVPIDVRSSSVWRNDNSINIAPGSNRAILLVTDACARMDRCRRITNDNQYTGLGAIRSRARTVGNIRWRPLHRTGYQLPAALVAWMEGKSADMRVEKVVSAE